MEKNSYIEAWKVGASAIKMAYEMYNQNPTEKIKQLAKDQIELIENGRPDKERTPEEQMSQELKECYDYLKRVAETGELE